jgi:hypothetical protein
MFFVLYFLFYIFCFLFFVLYFLVQIKGMLDVSSYVLLGQFSGHLGRFLVRLGQYFIGVFGIIKGCFRGHVYLYEGVYKRQKIAQK